MTSNDVSVKDTFAMVEERSEETSSLGGVYVHEPDNIEPSLKLHHLSVT